MSIETEFCAYLKEHDFHSFMMAWKQQYERLGRLGGSVDIVINEQNRECLSGFLGMDYYQKKLAHITWTNVQKAITQSRYEGAERITGKADTGFLEDLYRAVHTYHCDEVVYLCNG